ncbi:MULTISPECIES: hypothetical protein [unclassified Amycolatopsis]|uniref:hypothetical protein n=1 Tax=unclassified Amycolatopsis TaxID=2618356 RepID=UPI003451E699
MSDKVADSIALWLLLPSLALVVLVLAAQVAGTPRATRRRRRESQLGRLRNLRTGTSLHLDWLEYREIPKPELLDVLARQGWTLRTEDVGETAWTLHFARQTEPAEVGSARTRLAGELAAAEPDVHGRYLLDASQYPDLPLSDVRHAAESAGWEVRRTAQDSARPSLELARPGTTTVHDLTDGPFTVAGEPPSATALDAARQKHKLYARQFARQVRLALFYGFIGVFVLVGTLTSADGSTFWLLLAVSLIVLALCGLAVAKAATVRQRRRTELGEILDDNI